MIAALVATCATALVALVLACTRFARSQPRRASHPAATQRHLLAAGAALGLVAASVLCLSLVVPEAAVAETPPSAPSAIQPHAPVLTNPLLANPLLAPPQLETLPAP